MYTVSVPDVGWRKDVRDRPLPIENEGLKRDGIFSLLYHTQFTPERDGVAKTLLYHTSPQVMPQVGTAGCGLKSAFQIDRDWPIAFQRDARAVQSGRLKMAALGPRHG